jgi:tetratricopeptide (TPR) repeat protein/predicted Ser/Thr protein kinase
MALTIGENVGRYRVTEQLGQGGMATVYRAYDANLDRYVAIKVMHQAFNEDPSFLTRFRREAQIVANLRHPNMVAIHDFDEHNKQPYLVMEYVEGETLKARLKKQPLTLQETVTMMRAVSEALTYAHEQGILHRDIKPSNILLDKNGTPYLTDFGLARMVQAGESTLSQDMMLGTPQYISPEQAQGIKNLQPATDIYSLGIVLYQLVVGRVPFSADTPYAIVHDHIYKPLPMPSQTNPTVPVEVERVLLKALAKEPGDRYQTATAMIADFELAVQEAQLEELTPSVISTTDLPVTPSSQPAAAAPAIPAASPLTPSGMASISAAQARLKRNRMLWMLGGLAAFVFTCLAAMFVAVIAISDPNLKAEAAALPTLVITPTAEPQEIPQLDVDEAQALTVSNPNDPMSYFALGLALLEADSRLEAQRAISRGIELSNTTNPTLITDVAAQMAEGGHLLEALRLLMEAVGVSDNPEIRNQAGYYLYQAAANASLRDIIVFQRFVTNQSENAGGYALLGRSYITVGNLDRAGEAINTALEMDGNLPETHLILGDLYAAQGNQDAAVAEWRFAATTTDAAPWIMDHVEQLLAEQGP